MEYVKEKQDKSIAAFKKNNAIGNVMAAPTLEKVVISVGTGKITDKRKKELILDRVTRIAGQKAINRPAKTSIAQFKLREGMPIGVQVTLRGKRMNAFLDRFINIAIPRMRDFKGIDRKVIDEMGNCTIGVIEHTVFPETGDENISDVFGLAVTIVTSAKSKESAYTLLKSIGIPFKEPDENS